MILQVFVPRRVAKHVTDIFHVLVNDIDSYEEGRESPEIDYYLLGKGDLRETRFVLGKVIMDTMRCGRVQSLQMETEVDEEKNRLLVSYNEQKAEAPNLSEVVKHLIVAKVNKRISLFNSELQQEKGKKQKFDMKFDSSEEETAKEKQKEKTQKHQKMGKKLEIAENLQLQEMAMKQKMVDKKSDSSEQETAKEEKKEETQKHQKMAKKLEIAENVQLQQMAMKQEMVDMTFDCSEQETAKEKKKEKTQKRQKMAKKLEIAENVQLQEMAMKQLEMVGTENLQISTKRQLKVANSKHSGQQKLNRKQNEQHKLEEAVNQKLLTRKQPKLEEAVNQKLKPPSLSSLFK